MTKKTTAKKVSTVTTQNSDQMPDWKAIKNPRLNSQNKIDLYKAVTTDKTLEPYQTFTQAAHAQIDAANALYDAVMSSFDVKKMKTAAARINKSIYKNIDKLFLSYHGAPKIHLNVDSFFRTVCRGMRVDVILTTRELFDEKGVRGFGFDSGVPRSWYCRHRVAPSDRIILDRKGQPDIWITLFDDYMTAIGKTDEAWEKVTTVQREVKSALNNFNTLRQLLEGWPEVIPYARELKMLEPKNSTSTALAIPLQELNKTMGLPKAEETAAK